MINRVTIKNFKPFREITTDLEPLTVFVGPNASGKTSILEALHYLSQTVNTDPHDLFVGERWPVDIQHKGTDNGICISAGSSLHRKGFEYRLVLGKIPKKHGGNKASPWTIEWDMGDVSGIATDQFHTKHRASGDRVVFKDLSHAVFIRLDPRKLALSSHLDMKTRFENGGSGLPVALVDLKVEDSDRYNTVVEGLKSVVPAIIDIRLKKIEITETKLEMIEIDGKLLPRNIIHSQEGWGIQFDTTAGKNIPASSMSEGTLLVLGLLTVLAKADKPTLILLDDIDRALHPKAQYDLISLIRKLMKNNPDLQIIATSHSPYLLDHLKPEEIRLTTLDENGCAQVGKLTDHPDFEKWKETMRPGEFWSSVGEDWIKDINKKKGGAD